MQFPKTLGPASLASIVKLLLDIFYFLLWIGLGFASLVMLVIIFSGAYRLTGLGPALPQGLIDLLQMQIVLTMPLAIIGLAAFTFIVHRLRLIFATLIAGDPFVPENAGHLRLIAIALTIYQLTEYTAAGVTNLILFVFGPGEGGEPIMASEFSLNIGNWVAIMALFVLSEVFREGTRLREEQKLTI